MLDTLEATPGLPPDAIGAPQFVELPLTWKDFYHFRGVLPHAYEELRRYPRYYYRGYAILELGQRFRRVVTKDLARNGIGFYHHEQLFPLQEARIWLPGEGETNICVSRCVRISPQCYECGATFLLEADRQAAQRQIARVLAGPLVG